MEVTAVVVSAFVVFFLAIVIVAYDVLHFRNEIRKLKDKLNRLKGKVDRHNIYLESLHQLDREHKALKEYLNIKYVEKTERAHMIKTDNNEDT